MSSWPAVVSALAFGAGEHGFTGDDRGDTCAIAVGAVPL